MIKHITITSEAVKHYFIFKLLMMRIQDGSQVSPLFVCQRLVSELSCFYVWLLRHLDLNEWNFSWATSSLQSGISNVFMWMLIDCYLIRNLDCLRPRPPPPGLFGAEAYPTWNPPPPGLCGAEAYLKSTNTPKGDKTSCRSSKWYSAIFFLTILLFLCCSVATDSTLLLAFGFSWPCSLAGPVMHLLFSLGPLDEMVLFGCY